MIRIVRTDFSDGQLEQWWKEKYQRGKLLTDTAFQSWSWNYCWWKHFIDPDPNRELFLLKALDGDTIIAVAPWFIQKRQFVRYSLWNYVLWIANELSPYPDLITEQVNSQDIWAGFLKYSSMVYQDIWFIFNDMHPRSSIIHCNLETYKIEKRQSSISLRLDFSKDYRGIDRFHPSMRRGLKKALQGYHASDGWGWELHVPSSTEERESVKRLCLDRFGSKCFFRKKRNTAFFNDVSKRGESETFCSVLSKNGSIASIVMGFLHNDVFYYFLSGMNREFEHARPGLLNLYFLIEHGKNHGYRAFDFLKGTERYKTEFKASREELDKYFIHPSHACIGFKLYSFVQNIKNLH